MVLFEVKDEEVELNVPWIKLIPEFNALFDNKCSYKKQAKPKKVMAFIYFMLDFASPIRNWTHDEKFEQALMFTGLEKGDVEVESVKKAMKVYETLLYKACRPLRTYNAALVGLEKMDGYFETIDFSAKDKQGKLLYNPNQFTQNLTTINKTYDELKKLEARVAQDLSNNSGIRGKSELSDRELRDQQQKTNDVGFQEGEAQDAFTQRSMEDIGNILKNSIKDEEED